VAPGRLLIFEPKPHGHTLEWLCHLLRVDDGQAVCAVPPALAGELGSLAGAGRLLVLSEDEVRRCNDPRPAVSALARWRAMRRCLAQSAAVRGLFLEFDHLVPLLALGLPLGGVPLAGVLFRPSVHYGAGSPRERLRDRVKDRLYAAVLRRPDVVRLWSLDADFAAYAQDRYAGGAKVRGLPDPVHPAARPSPAPPAAREGRRCRFLLFGALAERKGVPVLLEALERLSPEAAARSAVRLAGRLDPAIADDVRRRIAGLRARQPQLELALDDRRLPDAEVAALVAGADVVLAPYQRFVGSSGVLLWAAAVGRPAIVQDYGLLGRLARRHGLGLAVDTTDPAALAAALETASARPSALFDRATAAAFAAEATPARFAQLLLENIRNERVPERSQPALA